MSTHKQSGQKAPFLAQTKAGEEGQASSRQATLPGERQKKVPLGAKLVVGGIAGMVGMTSVFPIDLVKTRLQNRWCESVSECVRRIRAEEGWRGFYRGLGACLCGVAPEKAVKLAVNEKLREHLAARDHDQITLAHEILAGAGAGMCQATVSNPAEIVKIRLQVQGSEPANGTKSAVGIVRELGFRGLYKGLPATLLRDVPFSFLFFPIYSNIRQAWLHQRGDAKGEVGLLPTLAAGAAAGAVAAAAVTPADVVKTRYQVEHSPYTSLHQCARAVWREGGPRTFFKGAVERMAIQAPLYGVALLAFELQKKWYLAHHQQQD
jgi:solute carrier family 25 aspartate/glutamate transporter 12/13